MSLVAGARIGPYEIVSALGAGGMGEVYRARDSKLGRDVAIKLLPALFSTDPERLALLAREARLLAALNHPHIATIHGLEEAGGVRALVMELVEGPTLSEKLAQGSWSRARPGVLVADALRIAGEIARGLEAAHEKGIIHRDLKPGNIKFSADGRVRLLDFGLAKAFSDGGPGSDLEHLPTITAAELAGGGIVGTPAYMSPEQARGQAVDKRTDIWAFGCVLYEMLAGRTTFPGKTVSDTIAAIIERDPDWSALPAETPPAVRQLLRRCLEKDPQQRLHDIADARRQCGGLARRPKHRVRDHGSRAAAVVAAGAGWAVAAAAAWNRARDHAVLVARQPIDRFFCRHQSQAHRHRQWGRADAVVVERRGHRRYVEPRRRHPVCRQSRRTGASHPGCGRRSRGRDTTRLATATRSSLSAIPAGRPPFSLLCDGTCRGQRRLRRRAGRIRNKTAVRRRRTGGVCAQWTPAVRPRSQARGAGIQSRSAAARRTAVHRRRTPRGGD